MRPLELRLRNFRSYFGDGATFDFRDRGLVGIVGPIGSGKSSLLDAISFALYGKTPAAGASTKALIHQRADNGGALLRFEVDGEIWEAVRSLRRRGASQHALYRYEADTPDADPVEKITLEADVNDRIAQLLGLDYEAFGRSVLLAQGRFAEFLRSRPAERDAVLKGVFGHDRIDAMRDAAKRRSAVIAVDLGKVGVRAEQLDTVAERLRGLEAVLQGANDRVELLRKAEPRLDDLAGQIEAATAEAKAARQRLAELGRHASRLPAAEATERLVQDAAGIAASRVALAAELEDARLAAAAAEEAVASARESGEAALIDAASRLLAAADPQRRAATEAKRRRQAVERRLAEAVDARAAADEQLAAARRAAADAETAFAAACKAADDAEAAYHEAQHANMAEALRSGLAEGDACPVCAQQVLELPAQGRSADVAAAESELAAARTRRTQAETTRSRFAAKASAAVEAVHGSIAAVESLEAEKTQAAKAEQAAADELDETVRRLRELLGDGDPVTNLELRRGKLNALGDAAAEARRRVDQIRSRHDQVIVDEQSISKRLSALRIDLADLSARLATAVVAEGDQPRALGRAVEQLRTAWEAETAAHQEAAVAAGNHAAAAAQERDEILGDLGVDSTFDAALAAAVASAEHLAAEVARDAAEIAAGDELLEQRDRLTAEKARYDRIAADLTDSRFVRFLLDDERARLADLGSDHFARLSAGRYLFTDDGSFSIVDLTAADAVRKASSLSGGETFLASLALALALAEMVARTGGRLDAFFLDEGFGSLDPEHLDLAMEGIEALVADNASRLVVVVSHVPELRHRIEDLIELDRDPLTGDTRIVRS